MRAARAVIIESLLVANRYYGPQKSGMRFFSNTDGWKTKIEQNIGCFFIEIACGTGIIQKKVSKCIFPKSHAVTHVKIRLLIN